MDNNQKKQNEYININNLPVMEGSNYNNSNMMNQNYPIPNQNTRSNMNNINNSININVRQTPTIQESLGYAYNCAQMANVFLQQFSFYDSLFKFNEAYKITNDVIPLIEDNELKAKAQNFLNAVSSQIQFVELQIKNRFEYKESAGFARKEENKKKVDYLECLRKDNYLKESTCVGSKENSSNTTSGKAADTKKPPEDKEKIVTDDLKNRILTEIVENKPNVKFQDIIGLTQAKQILKEIIILPSLRPDLFTGLRSPPKGMLLFGPPGVGKTMLAKAVATECNCTFFNISASSLTSKYLGESEKLVRALFDLAKEKQPSVIFIDEIDSILSKRTDNENDAVKRLKTQFLIEFDGVGSDPSTKSLIIGATNRPQDLDSAVLRRLPKRIYISPFDESERVQFIKAIMKSNDYDISDEEFNKIAYLTANYSNSDLKELCREAVYEAVRETDLTKISELDKLRPTVYEDFIKAIKMVRGTLSEEILSDVIRWNEMYGALSTK
jgi:SpoVK/Ycf46/Vps4 family AAA+-type ATPase